MPLYMWKDKRKQEEPVMVEIMRSFDDSDDVPSEEEAADAGWTPEQYKNADWEKHIGGGIRVVKGRGWGPGKGYW